MSNDRASSGGTRVRRIPSLAGRVFRTYRKLFGLTQEQLAEQLDIGPRTLRAYEKGERQVNNIQELRRMAETLGIAPEYLGVASVPPVLTAVVMLERKI
jgi:transcriptional regulator with XRE-family HTH domain